MKKAMKAVAAIMLTMTVVFAVGCKKDNADGDGVTNGHTYVDLGLPSGTLWAACNVGADSPEKYGDYFAWGETKPKSSYNWSTYKYCNNGDNHQLTKYCYKSDFGYNGYTDALTTLLPEDDAATVNWGNEWRMPTYEECNELRQETTIIWTTQNGIKGMLCTGSNGNSIFLPAAGGYLNDELHGNNEEHGDRYWTSSHSNYPQEHPYVAGPGQAWDCADGIHTHYDAVRCYGKTVRPVRSAGKN